METPGPVEARLLFRVGTADETLPQHGTTHLVEHLAMVPLHWTPYGSGAWVEEGVTAFWAEGSMDEVSGFLSAVTRSLGSLPLDRIGIERAVLASEAADRGAAGYHRRLMALRFGPAGWGLGNFSEMGLRAPTAESVDAWRRRFFTAGNAVVWMTARPPDDLELDLPPGEAVRPPEPEPIAGLRLPAQEAGWDGEVAFSLMVRRTYAVAAAGQVAERRAEDALRMERGLTYGVDWDYGPMTADAAVAFIAADSIDANAVAVRDGIERVLDNLASEGPTEEELARLVAEDERWADDPGFAAGMLDHAAEDHLRGRALDQPEEAAAARRELRPEDVAAAVREALPTALLVVPDAAGAAPGRYAKYGRKAEAVEGVSYRERWIGLRRPRGAVVLGDGGVSAVRRGEDPATVRFDQAVALVDREPGTFVLHARDRSTVVVAPDDFRGGQELERELRARVPAELHVPRAPQVAALARAAEGLPRLRRVSAELDELPRMLAPDEVALALAEARRRRGLRTVLADRRRLGAVLATDRRLLWLYAGGDEDRFELPWEAVRSVRRKGTALVVEGAEESLRLRRVRPVAAAETIVIAFAERARQGTTLSEA